MPPQRTVPPTKAVKTERTHEENQERAYIAASRRSDRSLEARVESARRASEIHKRRTGRSLRVTEQDVVNEEMYEEEDDDLPMQYRRLTAHLQTGSVDFNRRLAAYLTNHVAMRSALDQAITHSYAQQYPNAPQFAHNQQTMFPSPLMPQNFVQQPQQPSSSPQQQTAHQKPHQQAQPSPHPYRQSPYQTPGTPGYRKHPHIRSMSSSTSHDVPGFVQDFSKKSPVQSDGNPGSRRMSMPATGMAPVETSTSPSMDPSNSPSDRSKALQSPSSQPMPPPPMLPYNNNMYQDTNPLSTSLPPETQMMLGNMFDINDPLGSMFMTGSGNMPQSFYNFDGQVGMSKLNRSFDGMNATLAPSMLDMSPNNSNGTDGSSAIPTYNYGYDNLGDYKGLSFVSQNSGHGSGSVTPGNDGGWDAFINDNSWTENAT